MNTVVRAINELVPEVESNKIAYKDSLSFHRVDRDRGCSYQSKGIRSCCYSAHLMEVLIPDMLTVSKMPIYQQDSIACHLQEHQSLAHLQQ
jgi:hypothetical protein